jgi:hypothetical protein
LAVEPAGPGHQLVLAEHPEPKKCVDSSDGDVSVAEPPQIPGCAQRSGDQYPADADHVVGGERALAALAQTVAQPVAAGGAEHRYRRHLQVGTGQVHAGPQPTGGPVCDDHVRGGDQREGLDSEVDAVRALGRHVDASDQAAQVP